MYYTHKWPAYSRRFKKKIKFEAQVPDYSDVEKAMMESDDVFSDEEAKLPKKANLQAVDDQSTCLSCFCYIHCEKNKNKILNSNCFQC